MPDTCVNRVISRTCAAGAEALEPAAMASALALLNRERGRVHAAGIALTKTGVTRVAPFCSMSGLESRTGVARGGAA